MKPWRFYVYQLVDDAGIVQYVGKGSSNRLACQKHNFGLEGYEVARFKRESDAYAYEVKRIAECSPLLNKHKGGNGSRVTKQRNSYYRPEKKQDWQIEMDRIGSRAYAARFLLQNWPHMIDPNKIEQMARVAWGPRIPENAHGR
jgi:hypothetical protein